MTESRAKWNVELGRQLYDQGLTYKVIGNQCGTTEQAIKHYGRVHWGVRPLPYRPKTTIKPREKYINVKWDFSLGAELWLKGLSYSEIAEQCGTTKNAVCGFANRNWSKRREDAERHAKHFPNSAPAQHLPATQPRIRMFLPGEPTLPPLPSLTFGDD